MNVLSGDVTKTSLVCPDKVMTYSFNLDEDLLAYTPQAWQECVNFYETIYEKVEEGSFSKRDPEFLYFHSSVSLSPATGLMRPIDNETVASAIDACDLDQNEIEYSAIISLVANYEFRNIAFENHRERIEDDDLFSYILSEYLFSSTHDTDIERRLADAVSTSLEASDNCPTNFYVHFRFANIVRQSVEKLRDFSGVEEQLSMGKTELLNKAIERVNQSIDIYPQDLFLHAYQHHSKHPQLTLKDLYAVLAHLEGLNGNPDRAGSALDKATKSNNFQTNFFDSNDIDYISRQVRLRETLTKISDMQNDVKDVGKNLSDMVNDMDNLQADITDAESRLDTLVDESRSIIQYIAFFAGVISIIVVSAQISVASPSFSWAARLILVLTGGLVLAFTGFSLLVPYQSDDKTLWFRIILFAILAILLIVIGFVSREPVGSLLFTYL